MDEFAQRVQEWQLFYATIAGSSATLVGLLFVALSVNPEAASRAKDQDLRTLARQTFTTFLYIIGIALTFLVPRQVPLGVGLPLAFISIVGLRYTLADVLAARRNVSLAAQRGHPSRRGLLRIAALLMLIAIAAAVLAWSDAAILGWMVAPMLILLISASLNTWDLLVAMQEASKKG